jgi:hypothetical protein
MTTSEQGVLACAAARVEHVPGKKAAIGQADESRLRPADVPRRGIASRVDLIPPGGGAARIAHVTQVRGLRQETIGYFMYRVRATGGTAA